MSCLWKCIPTQSVAVIERCGKFNRLGSAGFNWVICCFGDSVAGSISLRVQQLDVSVETKTKDNVFVRIVVSVQYQALPQQVYDAFYKLADNKAQITAYVFDVVRSTVPKLNLDDVFTSKVEIAGDVKEELQKAMGEFGYQILQTLVTDIDPEARVKAAMNEINAAQRLRQAAFEKAEADKVRVVKAAEADAESKYLAGQGIARQRQAIVNGLRDSVMAFESEVEGITSHDVVQMMLMTQYFDMLKDVGTTSGNNSIFVPHTPGAVGQAMDQVRAGFAQAAQIK